MASRRRDALGLDYAAKWPRMALMSCVLCRTSRSRVRSITRTDCCFSVLMGTERIDGRFTTPQIAAASAASALAPPHIAATSCSNSAARAPRSSALSRRPPFQQGQLGEEGEHLIAPQPALLDDSA